MFIHSRKSFHFWDETGRKFDAPIDYIGEIPEWVEHTTLFKLAVSDGSITMVGETTQVAVNAPDTVAEPAADAGTPDAPVPDGTAADDSADKTDTGKKK